MMDSYYIEFQLLEVKYRQAYPLLFHGVVGLSVFSSCLFGRE